MVIGTTAPFSAISGAVIWICALSVDPLPPSALRVSATLLVSNAALFIAAQSLAGSDEPAAAASASTPARYRTEEIRDGFDAWRTAPGTKSQSRFYRGAAAREPQKRNIVVHVVELAAGFFAALPSPR